ncbi:hypothetical protein ACA29_02805 [Lederbergia galactosidilytica]|uniref:Uncharacterized protein n=1 Tax=Lederbergia galactosidilytica TaxID=217031 RepID=A0A0Q9Y7N6_9BACI|nr:hypothetical protein ACA29_02805 [Lederbergia galactosidilytica]
MSASWEKRFSFRLTDGDEELGRMLDNVPKNKRSEMIRNMLKFAYRTMTEEQRTKKELAELKQEIQGLRESYTLRHEELLRELRKGIQTTSGSGSSHSKEVNQDSVSEDALRDSANAFLKMPS